MALKLNGKPISKTSIKAPSPAYDRLIVFLESQPDDELFTLKDIMQRGICGKGLLKSDAPNFEYYRMLIPRGSGNGFLVFGNPRAIMAAKKWAKKELGETV